MKVLTDPEQAVDSNGFQVTDQLALNLLLGRNMVPVKSCPASHCNLTGVVAYGAEIRSLAYRYWSSASKY
jgi:hypothetical protein